MSHPAEGGVASVVAAGHSDTLLRTTYHLVADMAAIADDSDYGRMVSEDLAFIGITGIGPRTATLWRPYAERLDAFIRDASPGQPSRILEHMRRNAVVAQDLTRVTVDAVTRAFLEARRCSPAALTLLSRMAEETSLVEEGDPETPIDFRVVHHSMGIPPDDRLCVAIPLGDGMEWKAGRITGVDLPDTLAAAAPGRRLSEVLSHPLLDRHPARIERVDPYVLTVHVIEPPTPVFQEAA